jgi:hypothetical protein
MRSGAAKRAGQRAAAIPASARHCAALIQITPAMVSAACEAMERDGAFSDGEGVSIPLYGSTMIGLVAGLREAGFDVRIERSLVRAHGNPFRSRALSAA